MKRRVLSFIIALALCLNLFPVGAFAAGVGADEGLCPHHPAHTDACGYVLPVLEQECTHSHDDGCYTAETDCIHEHTAECWPDSADAAGADEPDLCAHVCTQDSGCVTQMLSCQHEHDEACGYAEGNPGAPCTFVCPICPIEDLIDKLPRSISAHNAEQVQAQIGEIYDLYDALASDEQQQVDLSPCAALLDQIDGMASAVQSDETEPPYIQTIYENKNINDPILTDFTRHYNLNTFTVSALKTSAMQVTGTGKLYLEGSGKVISKNGAGIEVQTDGFLSIAEDVTVEGSTYALDIASGAEVHLSAGTYTGKIFAIRTEDGDFDALLEPGYTWVDAEGNRIQPENAKTVTVGQCTDHSNKSYVHDAGTTTHKWTCNACKKEESEPV